MKCKETGTALCIAFQESGRLVKNPRRSAFPNVPFHGSRARPRVGPARARAYGGLGSRNATQMQDQPKSPHATPCRPVSAHLPRPSDPDAPPGPGRGPETPFGAQGRHSRWAPSGETAGAQGAERNPSLLQPSPPIQNRFVACEGDVRGFQGLVGPSEVAGRHP